MPFVEYCERCAAWLMPNELEICAKCLAVEYVDDYEDAEWDDRLDREREEGC